MLHGQQGQHHDGPHGQGPNNKSNFINLHQHSNTTNQSKSALLEENTLPNGDHLISEKCMIFYVDKKNEKGECIIELCNRKKEKVGETIVDEEDYYSDVMDYLRNICRNEFGEKLIRIYNETCIENIKEEKTNQAHEDYIDWGDMPLEAPNSGVDLTSAFRTLRKEIEPNTIITNGAGNYAVWGHRLFRFTNELGMLVLEVLSPRRFGAVLLISNTAAVCIMSK